MFLFFENVFWLFFMVCLNGSHPKIIKQIIKNHPKIQKIPKTITNETSKNHPKIILKSPPKKDYNPPKLQVKIRINNNIIIIISCTAVQLFQESIILWKGWKGLKGLSPPARTNISLCGEAKQRDALRLRWGQPVRRAVSKV